MGPIGFFIDYGLLQTYSGEHVVMESVKKLKIDSGSKSDDDSNSDDGEAESESESDSSIDPNTVRSGLHWGVWGDFVFHL